MEKFTQEFLESKLPEYLATVRPSSFSWGNKEHVEDLIKWVESNR